MNAICHQCGSSKQQPLNYCHNCGSVPRSEDEAALAIALSSALSTPQQLEDMARSIKAGKKIILPPELKNQIVSALKDAREKREGEQRRRNRRKVALFLAVGLALFVWLHPYPSFTWASLRHSVESYESFLQKFPYSDYSADAREHLRKLKEDGVWADVVARRQISPVRDYIEEYPDGNHLKEAAQLATEIADEKWAELSDSRSDTAIKTFIQAYPETSKNAEATARLEELYTDLAWVRESGKLEHFVRFAERFPKHPEIASVNKAIIDLEVQEIASGKYGEMPPAEAISLGGSAAHLEVENKTGYVLTVRYSGPDSRKMVIPVGETQSLSLKPGQYQVAASVSAAHVTNYYGKDSMQGGRYSSSFYIEEGYGGSSMFGLPDFDKPTRRKR